MKELKILGIKKIVSDSKLLKVEYGRWHIELAYNLETGRLLSEYIIGNGYVVWSDNVVPLFNIYSPTTMQQLKESVTDALYAKSYDDAAHSEAIKKILGIKE